MAFFSIMEGIAGGTKAGIEFNSAAAQEAMGKDRAMMQLFQGLSSMVNTSQEETMKSATSELSTLSQVLLALPNTLAKAEAELAKVLSE